MEHLLVLAYWSDRVETYGGRRRELPRLLRRYCRGATRVVVYEARETIWDVRHVPKRLRHVVCRKWMVRVRLREQR